MNVRREMIETAEKTIAVSNPDILQAADTKPPAISDNQAANNLMSMVQRLATDPNIDLARVDHAFNLFERFTTMQAEKEFNGAMAKAQQEIGPVAANCTNKHTGSTFADLSAVHTLCKPIWTKHGFSVSSEYYSAEKDGWIGVKCEVMHSGGFKKEYKNIFPLDAAGSQGKTNKTAIQAIGSTGSYARRYIELMIFDISIDRDNDGNGGAEKVRPEFKPLTDAHIKTVRDALAKAEVTEQSLLERLNVVSLSEIQQGKVKGILNGLAAKAKELSEADKWLAGSSQ